MIITNSSTETVCAAQAQNQEKESSEINLPEGEYLVEVQLSGGSGRASVTSPAALSVSEEEAVVEIEWSSPYYDYMTLDGETYYPVNTEGNSVFELPVTAFDTEIAVTADTTAMSGGGCSYLYCSSHCSWNDCLVRIQKEEKTKK